jgi:hypothetical protein
MATEARTSKADPARTTPPEPPPSPRCRRQNHQNAARTSRRSSSRHAPAFATSSRLRPATRAVAAHANSNAGRCARAIGGASVGSLRCARSPRAGCPSASSKAASFRGRPRRSRSSALPSAASSRPSEPHHGNGVKACGQAVVAELAVLISPPALDGDGEGDSACVIAAGRERENVGRQPRSGSAFAVFV